MFAAVELGVCEPAPFLPLLDVGAALVVLDNVPTKPVPDTDEDDVLTLRQLVLDRAALFDAQFQRLRAPPPGHVIPSSVPSVV
jgi:hypothetical protein